MYNTAKEMYIFRLEKILWRKKACSVKLELCRFLFLWPNSKYINPKMGLEGDPDLESTEESIVK